MSEATLSPSAEQISDLLPVNEDDAACEGQEISVYGERETFQQHFVPGRLYKNATLPSHIRQFTEMQAAARDMSLARRSYALAAPTSSGKTISFAAPIFESGRPAVFVYPYRALLLDQASELLSVARWFGYGEDDFGYLMGGVTGAELTEQIRGRFLLSTPDKLISLFMSGRRGQMTALRILSSADFVFDEVHAYSPMMVRSLIYFIRSVRLWQEGLGRTQDPNKRPAFIFSSATLPPELWKELTEGLGMSEDDRITGPSNTGDVRVEILAPRASKRNGEHPVAYDIEERNALGHAMVVMNSPFDAYQICKTDPVSRRGLLFVGQDKQPEDERRRHLYLFGEGPADYILVGSNAIEAGVDMSARHLFMETSFRDSTVQRFGRAARSGRDAQVVLYGPEMLARLRDGQLRKEYTRAEFNDLLNRVHPARPVANMLTALAAGPYIAFWGAEAHRIVEPEDMDFDAQIRENGAPSQLAFRSLSPYTSYQSGERIGFSPLFRKNLPLENGEVVGRPAVDRYFNAKRRPTVRVELRRIAHREQTQVVREGITLPVHLLLAEADFGPFGRHWSVFEVGPGGTDTPDNMILTYRGRDLNGPESAVNGRPPNVARFYG